MTSFPKEQARQLVKERLDKVSPEMFEKSSQRVNYNLHVVFAELCKQREIKRVLLYTAMKKYREVDIAELQFNFPDIRFDYAPSSSKSQFPEGTYDCIVVPLLSFNDKGYRLGRGGGWYDRFLLTQPGAYKIGVGLEISQIDFVTEMHDIPLDCIITEIASK